MNNYMIIITYLKGIFDYAITNETKTTRSAESGLMLMAQGKSRKRNSVIQIYYGFDHLHASMGCYCIR